MHGHSTQKLPSDAKPDILNPRMVRLRLDFARQRNQNLLPVCRIMLKQKKEAREYAQPAAASSPPLLPCVWGRPAKHAGQKRQFRTAATHIHQAPSRGKTHAYAHACTWTIEARQAAPEDACGHL